MHTVEQKTTERGLQDVSIIASIIMRLANYAVTRGETLDGPELAWLAQQLDNAVEMARGGG